jgi:hypothetical protein
MRMGHSSRAGYDQSPSHNTGDLATLQPPMPCQESATLAHKIPVHEWLYGPIAAEQIVSRGEPTKQAYMSQRVP